MSRINNRWSALITAAFVALGITMLGSGAASAAAAPARIPIVQVAAASDVPVGVDGETFHTFAASVYMGSNSNPYLTGFANADGPIYVDDVLQIQACGASSQLCSSVYRHDLATIAQRAARSRWDRSSSANTSTRD